MGCGIWYHLHNFKNVKNTHGELLLLVSLQLKVTPRWVFFSSECDYKISLQSEWLDNRYSFRPTFDATIFQSSQKTENHGIFYNLSLLLSLSEDLSYIFSCRFPFWIKSNHCLADIYLFKDSNKNITTVCEIYPDLTKESPDWSYWGHFGVFVYSE